MTNTSFPVMTEMVNIAIRSLAQRTDPITDRLNAGEIITNLESKQLVHDIFNLASLMKTAAAAVDAATGEIETLEKENAIMKTLLGLSDSDKAGK